MFVINRVFRNFNDTHLRDAVECYVVPKLFASESDALDFIKTVDIPAIKQEFLDWSDYDKDETPDDMFDFDWSEADLILTVEGCLEYEYGIVEAN